jgi:anti-sigma28 factor (negative regulator of flagellin synthesis)
LSRAIVVSPTSPGNFNPVRKEQTQKQRRTGRKKIRDESNRDVSLQEQLFFWQTSGGNMNPVRKKGGKNKKERK